MINLARNGYSHEQVRDVLHAKHGSRQIRFRYFLLDKNENEKAEITEIFERGSISMSAFADIKRTAQFRIKDDDRIDYNSDRIQVFAEFKVPDWMEQTSEPKSDEATFVLPFMPSYEEYTSSWTKKEGGWIDFALGVFLIATPTKIESGEHIYRDIEAYDKLLIAKEDKVTERYTITKNTTYYQAMKDLLDSMDIRKYNIENNGKTLKTDKEYEIGTEKLAILNDLASDINFTPFWVDEYGFYTTNQYRSPQEQQSDYTYENNELSVTELGTGEELDTFNIPNVFTVVVSNPDTEDVFSSTVENTNPNHPRSIPNLGRRVVRFEEKDDIADQASLDAFVERLAFESSQVYGRVRFSTAIMPFHSYSNVLRIINTKLGINDKYAETNWKMTLENGASMEHEVRRVVSLS